MGWCAYPEQKLHPHEQNTFSLSSRFCSLSSLTRVTIQLSDSARQGAARSRRSLSLEEMEITIRIDNGDARVFVRQIFANHCTGIMIEEGKLCFSRCPPAPTVSDFAVWDRAHAHSRCSAGAEARGRNLHAAQSNRRLIPDCCKWENAGPEEASAELGFQRPHRSPFNRCGTKLSQRN